MNMEVLTTVFMHSESKWRELDEEDGVVEITRNILCTINKEDLYD